MKRSCFWNDVSCIAYTNESQRIFRDILLCNCTDCEFDVTNVNHMQFLCDVRREFMTFEAHYRDEIGIRIAILAFDLR